MWYEKQLVLELELVSLLVQVELPQQVYEVPKEQGKTIKLDCFNKFNIRWQFKEYKSKI